MQLSRAATFQSLSLLAIVAYLILMMSVSRAVELTGGNWLEIAQVVLLFGDERRRADPAAVGAGRAAGST